MATPQPSFQLAFQAAKREFDLAFYDADANDVAAKEMAAGMSILTQALLAALTAMANDIALLKALLPPASVNTPHTLQSHLGPNTRVVKKL